MVGGRSESEETWTVSYIDTDIDCPFCFADVKAALIALPDVVDVESSPGCLVVSHRTDIASLLEIVDKHGRRLIEADNGEMAMGSVAAAPVASCTHRVWPSGRETDR